MTRRVVLFPALLVAASCLLPAGVAAAAGLGGTAAPSALIPDFRTALERMSGGVGQHPDAMAGDRIDADVLTYFRAWLGSGLPEDDGDGRLDYAMSGTQDEVMRGLERLLAGYQAYCTRAGGQLRKRESTPGQLCAGGDDSPLAQLSVDVVHAVEAQPAQLAFSVESGERVRRLQAERSGLRARLADARSKPGLAGSVVLTGGAAFEVARFGRLWGPDCYAVRMPGQPPVPLADILSARWSKEALVITRADGTIISRSGKDLSPARTLVRLLASGSDGVEIEPMTYDAPLRFVVLEGPKRPRQVRVRNIAELLEITVARKAPALPPGPLSARIERHEQSGFNRRIEEEAHNAARKSKVTLAPLDPANPEMRQQLERMGVTGPCASSQSDVALQRGDLSFSEFFACAEYRREAKVLLANGGVLSADKTPLVYLGRLARAPWFDFNGVLR